LENLGSVVTILGNNIFAFFSGIREQFFQTGAVFFNASFDSFKGEMQ
jgi:hypothetical protein